MNNPVDLIKNKKTDDIINELENLYLKEYYDYNFTAFYDEINNKYDISYDVMLKAFKKDDIISPLSNKKTIKLYNENIKKTIKENKIENQEKKWHLKFQNDVLPKDAIFGRSKR